MNIIDEVDSSQFPFLLPMAIYIALERAKEEPLSPKVSIKIEIAKTELLNSPIKADFVENSLFTRAIINVGGLVITAPGELIVTLFSEKDSMKTYKIHVRDNKAKITESQAV